MTGSPNTITVEALLLETDWLRALCRQLVREEDHAEDLFQETVLASLVSANQRRGGLRPWLTGIAKNLVASRRRSEERVRERERAVASPEAVPPSRDTDAWVAMQQEVIGKVRELPFMQREVLLLRYFEDLPPREIAERLGVPVNTVKTRLRRGLDDLRKQLDAEHGDRERWVMILIPFVGGPNGELPAPPPAPEPVTIWAAGATSRVATVAALIAVTTMAWIATLPPDEVSPTSTADATAEPPPIGAEQAAMPPAEPTRRRPLAAPAARSTPTRTERFEVEVFEDTEPVDGAVIRYARIDSGAIRPSNITELESALRRRELTYTAYLAAVSSMTLSDAAGQADIPLSGEPDARLCIVAEFGNSEARTEVAEKDLGKAPIRLELRCRPFISVQVVTTDGQPAGGIPIDYLIDHGVYARGATAASGEPLRLPIPFANPDWLERGQVRLALPLKEAETAAAVASDTEADTVTLRLPETASLRVEVLDPRGRPLDSGELLVYRDLPRPMEGSAESPAEGAMGDCVGRAPVRAGAALIPRISPDSSWRLVVLPDNSAERWYGRARSPGRAGQSSSTRLQAPTDRTRVAVSISTLDSAALHGRPVEVVIRDDRGRSVSHRLSPDAEGTIYLPCEPGQARAEMSLRSPDPEDRRAAPLGAILSLPRIEADQPTAFVRALLRPMEPLVAGRVVDSEGRPVSNARVDLVPADSDGARLATTTDRDGRFSVYGLDRSLRYHVTAARSDRSSVSRDWVARGERDLLLVFRPVRRVSGALICGGAERQLVCRLRPSQPYQGQEETAAIEPDGRFSFQAVPTGWYSLEVQLALGGAVLHSQAIDVVPGDAAQEIPPVDLGGLVKLVQLTVKHAEPLQNLVVTVRHREDASNLLCSPNDDGQIRLIVPPGGLDVSIAADGYDPLRIERLDTDREVTLDPASPVGRSR